MPISLISVMALVGPIGTLAAYVIERVGDARSPGCLARNLEASVWRGRVLRSDLPHGGFVLLFQWHVRNTSFIRREAPSRSQTVILLARPAVLGEEKK